MNTKINPWSLKSAAFAKATPILLAAAFFSVAGMSADSTQRPAANIDDSASALRRINVSTFTNCKGPLESNRAVSPGKTQHLTAPDQVPEGLAKSDWASIRAAYQAGQHAVQPVEGGWQARNPGQQWTTKFDGRGFVTEPKGGGWQWGLELKSYGFAGQERAVGGVPGVEAVGQRLSYQWDGAVQEWWVNDGRGLEPW